MSDPNYERLKDAARELASAAKEMREADSNLLTISCLCSAVAGTLLDPGCWTRSLEPMASAVADVARDGLPDKLRRT